jgi:hypothetical protein
MAEDEDAEIEREIRQGRKFTPREALANMAGPGAMKGASPVSRHRQAEMAVGAWLKQHLPDADGALQIVLHRQVAESRPLLDNPDEPLSALAGCCQRLLASEALLEDVVRQADVEWGRLMDERPHFERGGALPHPDDPYTLAAVRRALGGILRQLEPPNGGP